MWRRKEVEKNTHTIALNEEKVDFPVFKGNKKNTENLV
jgi:hypothetical protein